MVSLGGRVTGRRRLASSDQCPASARDSTERPETKSWTQPVGRIHVFVKCARGEPNPSGSPKSAPQTALSLNVDLQSTLKDKSARGGI